MKKFLIFLGLFLLMVYSFRSCEDVGPRTLGAYGIAKYNPDEASLTIQDELDTVHKTKTYMTTYARMGWCGEEIDWNKKIYVYITEGYVSVVANVNLDRANGLQLFCTKLAYHDFIRSFTPWVMFLIGFVVLLLFLFGIKLLEKGNPKGQTVLNSIWWGIVIVFVLNVFHLFDFIAQTKNNNPVVAHVTESELSLNIDAVSGLKSDDFKFFYEWEGAFFASSSKLEDSDIVLIKCSYHAASEWLVRTIVILTLMCLIIAVRKEAKNAAEKRFKHSKETDNNVEVEPES